VNHSRYLFCRDGHKAATVDLLCSRQLSARIAGFMLHICTHVQLSSLYPSLYPDVTRMIIYPWPSPLFPYCKQWKSGDAWKWG